MGPRYDLQDLRRFGFWLAGVEIAVGLWIALTAGAPLFDLGNMASTVAILVWGLALTSVGFSIWAPEGNTRPVPSVAFSVLPDHIAVAGAPLKPDHAQRPEDIEFWGD